MNASQAGCPVMPMPSSIVEFLRCPHNYYTPLVIHLNSYAHYHLLHSSYFVLIIMIIIVIVITAISSK